MHVDTHQSLKDRQQRDIAYEEIPASTGKVVIGLQVTGLSYREFIQDVLRVAQQRKPAYACFANVHMLVEAAHDKTFASLVNKATWVTPDGVPLLWALRAFHGMRQERITGLDVLPTLLQEAAQTQLPVYIYGSTTEVLRRCKAFCAENYPGLRLVGMHSPPFRPLSDQEETHVINDITSSGAALVFVALGCPKQEKWMAALSDRIPAVLLGIGGALPVLVGEQKRAPRWMQKHGLEWLFRFAQEPRRLLGRYVSTNLWFIYYFFRQLIRQGILPRS
ncbi:WecB/TagA/CpsF family glycosyltransferase [Spirosoma pollinicola]|uniref:Glycosyltransferase n=1 Tax=Spirosoma pollinicola TaxID=2057025 RepID=A0A2K8Z8J0_9BACT|nr:WecB/TagA/CpsF family glycosyltransferase [Spirosoma pollinicola]AUD06187.1 glycosyltransferase [Spirosoma pollinicola]